AVGHRELERLGARMHEVGAVVPERLEVVALEDVEREQLGRALAGRGVLEHLVAAIVGRYRRLDLRGVLREVLVAEEAAVLLRELRQLARDVALVEPVTRGLERRAASLRLGLALGVDQLLERGRQVRVPEDLARL